MKKHTRSRFEEEWAKDNKGRAIPERLVDGDYQSSYFFSLIDEFERTFKVRVVLTLGLGLLCAIEQAGRDVLRFKHPNRDRFQNRECFDEFLQKYMGYRKIKSNRFDIFRNGIVHHGFPKSEKGSGVGIEIGAYYLSRKKVKRVQGIHIFPDGECVVTLSILLKEFETGVRKLRWHEVRYKWGRARTMQRNNIQPRTSL